MYNQLTSLYLHEEVLCRKVEPLDGSEAYLQQFIPPAVVTELITSLHNSATAGRLGTYRTIKKIRQRYYWPRFKEDVKKHIRCCDRCQKRAGPPRTHRHFLTDWLVSYPFHHIGLDFLGPLPISENCQYVLFNYSEEGIPSALENEADTDVTFYKNTTPGFSEVIPDGWLKGVSHMPKPLPVTQLSKYDLRHVTQATDSSVPPDCQNKFKDIVQE